MTAPLPTAPARLTREARTFARYLIGAAATPYAAAQYVAAHRVLHGLDARNRFEEWLTAIARFHWVATFLVDAFARFFTPRTLARRKLVLLLAILEVSPEVHPRIDSGWGPWLPAAALLAVRGLLLVAALACGIVVLAPLRLVAGLGDRR